MANLIKVKRGLESNRLSEIPAEGEFLYTTDEKKVYVGDGSTTGGIPVGASNNLLAVEGAVDLSSSGIQTLGSLPANADVLRTSLIVGTASNTSTTVTIGDATNGAASYMAASENDPEIIATYIASNFVSNGSGVRTINATVAVPGGTGSATAIVEYRLTTN